MLQHAGIDPVDGRTLGLGDMRGRRSTNYELLSQKVAQADRSGLVLVHQCLRVGHGSIDVMLFPRLLSVLMIRVD